MTANERDILVAQALADEMAHVIADQPMSDALMGIILLLVSVMDQSSPELRMATVESLRMTIETFDTITELH